MAAEHITDLATDHYLEFLATGVVLLDADLHIQALNLSAENLLEVSASRALGARWRSYSMSPMNGTHCCIRL